MLRAVMTIGTGRAAHLDGIALAAKPAPRKIGAMHGLSAIQGLWWLGFGSAMMMVRPWRGCRAAACRQKYLPLYGRTKRIGRFGGFARGALPKSGGIGALLRRLFGD